MVAGGFVGNANRQGVPSVERYEAGRWVQVSSMGQGRVYAGAGVVDGSMYVAGGRGPNQEFLASVERYEASSDTWTSVADMPEPRYGHCACGVGGCMYVMGGRSAAGRRLASVVKYDAGLDVWGEVAPLPATRYQSTACAVGSAVYVFGGCDDEYYDMATTYRYDTVANEWSTCAPMPAARYDHSACVLDGMVYVAGGAGTEGGQGRAMKTVFRYDLVSDTWSGVAPMLRVSGLISLFVLGGRIHAMNSTHTEVYDPVADSWSAGQAMGIRRSAARACAWKAEVNVFDAMIARARGSG